MGRKPLCMLQLLRAFLLGIGISAAPSLAAEGWLDVPITNSDLDLGSDDERFRLYSASKALVIGIENYRAAGWPKLSMAKNDARAVAEALKNQGFDVTILEDLTSDDLDRAFRNFFIKAGSDPSSRLFIWFAGHGHTIAGEGYLVPVDSPDPQKSDAAFRATALSLRRFGEYMREARAKHVLAVFDSCFAGTVFNVTRARPPSAITLSTALPVRQFISSGDVDQVVSDNGAFRRLFIDALQGREPDADANNDGYISGSELGLLMFNKVTNYSDGTQTPRYGKLNAQGYDRGDFIFRAGNLAMLEVTKTPAVTPSLRPGHRFRDCHHGCPQMVVVPPGTYLMGSRKSQAISNAEIPQHKVTIARHFAVGRFKVTNSEWKFCVADGACGVSERTGDESSVFGISQDDVIDDYIPWLSRKTGYEYRLLSEAEWEYVAKNNDSLLLGIRGMGSAVKEWIDDCFEYGYQNAPTDGSPRKMGGCQNVVVRGGSTRWESRSHAQRWDRTSYTRKIGFRVARTLENDDLVENAEANGRSLRNSSLTGLVIGRFESPNLRDCINGCLKNAKCKGVVHRRVLQSKISGGTRRFMECTYYDGDVNFTDGDGEVSYILRE